MTMWDVIDLYELILCILKRIINIDLEEIELVGCLKSTQLLGVSLVAYS